MTALRTLEYSGRLKALQPIAHGGKNSGTVHTFRTTTIFNDQGEMLDSIPMISGGTIRYSLRSLAAKKMHHFLTGDGTLPLASVHAMHNGGTMKETKGVKDIITGEKQALVRELLPIFGIFGGMGGARAISGRLEVESAIPVAKETAFLSAYYDKEERASFDCSIYELLERQRFGRFGTTQTVHSNANLLEEEIKGNMIFWGQEVLPAGTELFHSIRLNDATPVEVSFFREVIASWRKNLYVGQQKRVGMGRMVPLYTETITDLSDAPQELVSCDWRAELAPRREEALEALTWF